MTLLTAVVFTACQDRDIPGSGAIQIAAPDADKITCTTCGDNNYDCKISWVPANNGADVYLAVYQNWAMQQDLKLQEDNSFVLSNIETGVEYEFLLKYKKIIDGQEILSPGTVVKYSRPGALRVKNLGLKQIELEDGVTQELIVSWEPSANAKKYVLTCSNGTAKDVVTIEDPKASSYTIHNVKFKDTWNVEIVAVNDEGISLPSSASLLIGKTRFAFLSQYETPEKCVAEGDDDEASAWLWFHENYPEGEFLYFGKITSDEILSPYRMLFWMFDQEADYNDENRMAKMDEYIWKMKGAETAIAAAGHVKKYIQDGGSILLWQHAVAYIGYLQRLDMDVVKTAATSGDGSSVNFGRGGMNGDLWKMGASFKGSDDVVNYTEHPVFKNMTIENNNGQRLVPCKGSGWTEDHNFCLAGIPAMLTGMEINTNECYNVLTEQHGIYPLGTWDFQWERLQQLNVWEAKAAPKAPNGYDKGGSILCVGNGGFEFSLKNSDGTPDKSAKPKNNPQQANILQFAKNCIDYLMSI